MFTNCGKTRRRKHFYNHQSFSSTRVQVHTTGLPNNASVLMGIQRTESQHFGHILLERGTWIVKFSYHMSYSLRQWMAIRSPRHIMIYGFIKQHFLSGITTNDSTMNTGPLGTLGWTKSCEGAIPIFPIIQTLRGSINFSVDPDDTPLSWPSSSSAGDGAGSFTILVEVEHGVEKSGSVIITSWNSDGEGFSFSITLRTNCPAALVCKGTRTFSGNSCISFFSKSMKHEGLASPDEKSTTEPCLRPRQRWERHVCQQSPRASPQCSLKSPLDRFRTCLQGAARPRSAHSFSKDRSVSDPTMVLPHPESKTPKPGLETSSTSSGIDCTTSGTPTDCERPHCSEWPSSGTCRSCRRARARWSKVIEELT